MRVLAKDELHFTAPSEFNDPFECQVRIRMKDKMAGIADQDDPLLLRLHREKWRESLRVLSLTARRDDLLMWSHYADSHRGVCIGFDASTDYEWFGLAERVTYQAELPVVEFELKGDGRSIWYAFALTKEQRWSYEEE